MPTALEEYLFDLRGYLHLENAIDRAHVAELNALLDTYLDLAPDHWRSWTHRHNADGYFHLHNLFEIGAPFEFRCGQIFGIFLVSPCIFAT